MTSKIEKNLDRPKRVPMHEARQILNVDDLPVGKVGRWVIDSKNRCQVFEKAGWEYVTERGLTVGSPKVDGTKAAGNIVCKTGNSDGQMLYLMCIDQDFYDQDQLAKQNQVDQVEGELYESTQKTGHYGSLDLGRS